MRTISRERRDELRRNEPLCRERCYLEDRNMPLSRERCYYEMRKRQLFVLYNKNQKIMAQKTLTTSYLAQLTNANRSGYGTAQEDVWE